VSRVDPISPISRPFPAFSKFLRNIDEKGLENPVINYITIGDNSFVVLGSNRLKAARMLNITDQLKLQEVQLPFRGYKDELDVINGAIENGWRQ
jgi:hypothetical protein